MNLLRQSTSQIIRFGPFLDSTNGVTPETGLTIAQADMQLSKDGAAFAQKNAAGNATHDTDGWYSTTLNTTDTGTNAILLLQVNVSGALPVWHEFYVVPAASYDALTTAGLNNFDPASDAVADVTLVATTTVNTDMRGTDSAATAAAVAALNDFDPAADDVANVTLVATTTVNTDMRGTDSASTAAALAVVDGNVDSIIVDIAALNDVAATDIVTAGAITTLSGAVVNVDLVDLTTANTDMRGTNGANTVVPDNAGITANGAAIAALNDLSFADIWTGSLTESYATNGSAMTPAQALHMVWSDLRSPEQVGTVWNDYRLDNTTVVMSFSLDSATTPTVKIRVS